MVHEQYIAEFYCSLEARVGAWVEAIGAHSRIGPHNVGHALGCYVNFRNYHLRDEYCLMRHGGHSPRSALSRLVDLPKVAAADRLSDRRETRLPREMVAAWTRILEPLKGQKVYYANIQRMAEYIMPFVKREASPVVLISDSTIDHSALNPAENVTALHFPDSRVRLYRNDFLERCFPTFFSYANTIALLDMCLEPEEFRCVCGCQSQAKLWAAVCSSRGAASVCYQHGWPAFMHSAFKDMPFSAMVTWGPEFAGLWRPYNPAMGLAAGGYPYPIKDGTHDCITFFLQEPYYIATERTREMMLRLIVECAALYPERTVQYRMHPDSRLKGRLVRLSHRSTNIVDVSSSPLADVYASTRVAVAHYSSTILECVAHGCCPLVFNPSPSWKYHPDIEGLGLGFISTDPPSFHHKLVSALDYHVGDETKRMWFGKTTQP